MMHEAKAFERAVVKPDTKTSRIVDLENGVGAAIGSGGDIEALLTAVSEQLEELRKWTERFDAPATRVAHDRAGIAERLVWLALRQCAELKENCEKVLP